ncbi:hypothetical protein V6N13_134523 [Hibiscus sabdariffa]|uniref:Glycosyltransferase n=1 Tax=Hibiscus sabdariffa TaxID=183260 RepID=A0ABR2R4I9_9ROSI
MESTSSPVEMFFFPFVGGGHQIPMIDMARMFAAHGAKSVIISTPKHALSFRESIHRDQQSGRRVFIEILLLPDNIDIADSDMSATPVTDTSMLQEPLKKLLLQRKPDCIVHDMFHHWAADAIDNLELNVARIVLNGNGCFANCARENISKFKPQEKVDSKYEPFVLLRTGTSLCRTIQEREQSVDRRAGIVVQQEQSVDKAERGKKAAIDEQTILSWLHSKPPNSVLYISFGSSPRFAPQQILELAHGLQASNQPFIWVIRDVFKGEGTGFLTEFEEKMRESKQGLIINGWAPRLLILEHGSVGGFMTHCGWNSTLEGVSCGVPMITWPISAEQFFNEKLVTDVLKIGVRVGSLDWLWWNMEPWVSVGRDMVEEAVKRLMGGGEEGGEMRNKARVIGEMAKKAVEAGGSSYKEAIALINELKDRRRIIE